MVTSKHNNDVVKGNVKKIKSTKKSNQPQSQERQAKTHCRILERRMNNQILTELGFNSIGTCISQERAFWSSWCGKVGRTRVNIDIISWRQVDVNEKVNLWKECMVSYFFHYKFIFKAY